ncbi:MAG: HPr family phosphocarrier protein [Syntrophobacteraceae bacterium]|nr:HPr family phosphocarrier protein [Syntrophobacteraceae bacterium]
MLIDPRTFDDRRENALIQSDEESPALTQEFIVANRMGIHARVAAQIVKVACRFESEVFIAKSEVAANAKSILDVMSLFCPFGSKVFITARGPDAAQALSALAALFQTKFGEP